MSLFREIHDIREQIRTDYQDYMQAFAIQREAMNRLEEGLARQEKALARYQQKTDLIFDKIEQQFVEFDTRITRLERKVS